MYGSHELRLAGIGFVILLQELTGCAIECRVGVRLYEEARDGLGKC